MSAEAAKQNVSLQRINARATSCVRVCVYFPSKRRKDVRPKMCVCACGGKRRRCTAKEEPALPFAVHRSVVWLRLLYHHHRQSQALPL